MEIHFYSISDTYIAKVSLEDARVLSNHENNRKHMRPYIGFIIRLNNYDYFLPLSSSDPKDFDERGNLRPSTQTILRMINKRGRYLGKILLNNMLPVPESEITKISLMKKPLTGNRSEDIRIIMENKYKDLMVDELNWIKENLPEIISKSKRLYSAKTNENNEEYWKNRRKPNYLKATVDFKKIEKFVTEKYKM